MQHLIYEVQSKPNKLIWLFAIEIAALIILASFLSNGGDDLYNFYLPFAGGCLDCGFVPYFALWILAPLSWIPAELAWPALTIVSLGILLIVSRYTGANPLWLLLSFPTLSMLWLGQIDALIIAGLSLALLTPNPWLRGVGLSLALIKPQITGLAVIILLFYESKSTILKILVAPGLVILGSILVFGLDWPLRWLSNALQVPAHAIDLDVVDPLPYLLIPLLWFFQGRRSKFQAALFISTMASPYFGLYSYVIPLSFGFPWWGVLISYIWLVTFMVNSSVLRLAWIFPITLLLYRYFADRRQVKADPVLANV